MLLAVQKSLAETMKGCRSAMVGKAKAKFDGQSKLLAKTRCRVSGTLASRRTSWSLSRSTCFNKASLKAGLMERKQLRRSKSMRMAGA